MWYDIMSGVTASVMVKMLHVMWERGWDLDFTFVVVLQKRFPIVVGIGSCIGSNRNALGPMS